MPLPALRVRKTSTGEQAMVAGEGLSTSGAVSLRTSINTQTGASAAQARQFRHTISQPRSIKSATAGAGEPGRPELSTAAVQRSRKFALGLTGRQDRRFNPTAAARNCFE